MTYNDIAKKATAKYKKEKQRQISLSYKKEELEEKILPAIAKSGLPVSTFFKKAVIEKIERDGLSDS